MKSNVKVRSANVKSGKFLVINTLFEDQELQNNADGKMLAFVLKQASLDASSTE